MNSHAAAVILIMGLVTLATRLLPVLIFGRGDRKSTRLNSSHTS